ncbi:DUF2274 domain-containing protein [Flavisphingomonas formosensis]|uniref:DUF2274 domain-containing protein n=1 Tax=Flavisphingomonas formosensis TaxID=861534 RepID=UPI0012FAB2FF|nr:DUF2274 domain-containing protein [Sphingomonas formosensis]
MTDLKLGQLPDRTPVKISVSLPPELHRSLQDYARCYAAAYGREETVTELIPHMLAAFLAGDRGFAKAREALRESGK